MSLSTSLSRSSNKGLSMFDLEIEPHPVVAHSLPRLSPSQLGVFNRCEMVWYHTYIDELKKIKPNPAFFAKGTYFHQLLHFYYQLIQAGLRIGSDELEERMMHRIQQDLAELNDENIEVVTSVVKMVNRYINIQSPKIDGRIHRILGVEYPIDVAIDTPVGPIQLDGYIDLVYMDKFGNVYIRDHKTGQKNSWFQAMLDLESQLLMYSVSLTEMGVEKVKYGEINFANSYNYKKEPPVQDLFKLFSVEYSARQIANFREYLVRKATRILSLRKGEAEAEYTFTKDCGKCDFHDICKAELRGQPTNGLITQQYVKVDREKFRKENQNPDSPLDEEYTGDDAGVF